MIATVVNRRREHDYGFFVWTVPGFLMVFGVIAMFSIGMPFFALGAALLFYLLLRGPTWPADLGFISGIGAGLLFFAALATTSGEYSPTPWLEVGLALVATSAGLFWWLRCRPRRA